MYFWLVLAYVFIKGNFLDGGLRMKRLLTVITFLLLIYIVYYDLKIGTLPTFPQEDVMEVVQQKAATLNTDEPIPYQNIQVKKGDTVLSIVERIHGETVDISIETIVSDFEQLNKSTKAHNILIGQTYKFPIYK